MGVIHMNKILNEFCETYAYSNVSSINLNKNVLTGMYINKDNINSKIIAIDLNNIINDLIYKNLNSKCRLKDIRKYFLADFNLFLSNLTQANIIPIMVYDKINRELKDEYPITTSIVNNKDISEFSNNSNLLVKPIRFEYNKQNKYDRFDKLKNTNIKKYEKYKKIIDDFINYDIYNECISNALIYGSFKNYGHIANIQKSQYLKHCYLYHNKRCYIQNDLDKQYDIYNIHKDNLKIELYDVLDKYLVLINNNLKDFYNYDDIKDILVSNNITFVESDYEAEECISRLVNSGLVDYGLSNDSDLFMYQCKKILRKMDYCDPDLKCQLFETEIVMKGLNLNRESLIDLCIALGTDYNKPLKNIPYKKIYQYILTYGCPLKWPKYIDISDLNYLETLKIIQNKLNMTLEVNPLPKIPKKNFINKTMDNQKIFYYKLVNCIYDKNRNIYTIINKKKYNSCYESLLETKNNNIEINNIL